MKKKQVKKSLNALVAASVAASALNAGADNVSTSAAGSQTAQLTAADAIVIDNNAIDVDRLLARNNQQEPKATVYGPPPGRIRVMYGPRRPIQRVEIDTIRLSFEQLRTMVLNNFAAELDSPVPNLNTWQLFERLGINLKARAEVLAQLEKELKFDLNDEDLLEAINIEDFTLRLYRQLAASGKYKFD